MATVEQPSKPTMTVKQRHQPYENWMDSLGMPIYRDYYLEDLRTIKLGRWEDRGCDGAFIELLGQQGVTGAYVIEIPPGQTIAPFRLPMDEVCYILQGRGITSIKASESGSAKTFEWDARSLFMLPANHSYQLSNTTGNQTVRALICNYLPLAMSVMTSKDYLFNAPAKTPELLTGNGNFYSQAKVFPTHETAQAGTYWVGNFFPGHGRVGQDGCLAQARRRRPGHLGGVPRLAPDRPHVGVPAPHVQEGPPSRPRLRYRYSQGRGLLHHVAGGRREGGDSVA